MAIRLGMASILILILVSAKAYPDDPRSEDQFISPLKFSVNVGLVLLPVTVLDKSGRFVPNLDREAFTVYEDGIEQKIEVFDQKDLPVAVGLIIDNSKSMIPQREDVMSASIALAESSNPGDHIFVVHFHEHVVFALKLGDAFTSDIDELKRAVASNAGYGKTALYDAIVAGLEHVQHSELTRRVLVVISDGKDNSSRRTLKEATDMAAASNTMIYTIGIYSNRRESNPKALRQLAEITGGEVYFPGNGAQLSAACRHIATDIRSQYTLGYVPTNQKKDGVYREIKVTVNAPNAGRLTVRTRSGYLAR